MRLFYAADMHGSEQVWRKFVNAAKFFSADVLVLGGDLTGKVMVPVVEGTKRGEYLAELFGRKEKVRNEQELEQLEKRLRFNGFYPWRCTQQEYARAVDDVDYRLGVMNRLMVETAFRWVQIADEKLAGGGVRIYGQPGNDDIAEIDEALRSEFFVNVESDVVRVGDYQLLSCAWSNPSPWETPRELPEDQLLQKLEGLASRLEGGIPTIFNLHIPPYDSGLDTGPLIEGKDEQGQVVVKRQGGIPEQAPVGSKAVRTLIEEHSPVLSLHSHIHESKNVCTLGRTLCVNPGSNYQDGVLQGAIVELNGDQVVKYQLVSG
jgi:uncharacterized protein